MIDLAELSDAIEGMGRRSRLYIVLKKELKKLGHWRNLPRGDPAKGFKLMGTKKKSDAAE